MAFNSAMEALGALVHAYYDERNIEAALACVTDDVEWVGTEHNDHAKGKKALRKLLEADVASFPEPFSIELDEPNLQRIGSDGIMITVTGRQVAVPGVVAGFIIRGTACCVKTENGWLIANVHTSVPNSELEKYNLERELDETRKKEKLLLAGIPGGVAIYRQKRNGLFYTDYVSDGLAQICGYPNGKELCDYWKENAMINVVEADIPLVMNALAEGMKTKKTISVIYRVHVKDGKELYQRMDAKQMNTDLGEDDVAVWYAVHTTVSEKSLAIIRSQHQLNELIDTVPTGIGIFEVNNGVISQTYMNKAFYQMLGSSEEERSEYAGLGTLAAAHPDDLPSIQAATRQLMAGEQLTSVIYRLKLKNNKWFWIRLTAAVVERREHYIRVYGVFSDYNEIIKAQQEMENNRVTLKTALQSAKVLTWRYDYLTSTITDSLTLGEAFHLPKVIEDVPQTIIDMGFIADESIDAFRNLFVKIQTEDTASVDTKSNIMTENGYTWFKQIYVKTFDSEGNYVDCIAVAIDISEQKHREQQYEEQLRLNQTATKDALSKVYINLSRNQIISFSASTKAFKKHAQLKTANELLSSIRDDVSDREELKKFDKLANCQTIIDAFKKGTTHFEVTLHLRDVSKWTKVIYDVLENPYTRELEMISSVHDVTEQMRAELVVHKLMEVAYKSILLIDNQTGEAYPFKRDGDDDNIDEINAGILMENQENGLEAFFRTHALPDEAEEIIRENSPETICHALETNMFYETLYCLRENDRIVRYKVTYSYLENDKRILLSAVQDVTKIYEKELKQKNELERALVEADAANRAKTAFLSRISHDMRTPLNGILGLTTLLKDRITDEKVERDLTELELSGQYLLNLINDTLDMSRIESGKMELHPVVCEGRNLFNNALGLARQNIEAKHIKLNVSAEDIPFTMLYVDVARIQQVIMNVLGNATKFTPDGGKIDVIMKNLSVDDGIITDEIKIRDNGIGMSKEFLPRIFEAFEQEDATRTSAIQGTGLGMSITKKLLHLMGGDITVESELGKGSCFTIILKMPIATQQQIDAWKKQQVLADDKVVLQGRRVLLCEDHPLNTQIATRLLEVKGVIVEHAENGQIGVDMFSHSDTNYYDAVLMDIRMPVMDGLDAAKAIRSLPRRDARMVPIIAMTANAFAEDVKQTRDAGMDAHLSKPIQRELLYDTLVTLLKVDRGISRKKILVVDDEEVNRAIIIASLAQDYEILEAENGAQAMNIIENTRGLDVVITDIQMPQMDGEALIRRIKSDNKYRHIVVIANTQFGDLAQEEHLLALGANDFVYKPSNPKLIEIRVRSALRRG